MARALKPLLNSLWTARYGRVGMKPSGIGATLRGLVSRRGWKAPEIPFQGVQHFQGQGNKPALHDFFMSQGMDPRTAHDWLQSQGFAKRAGFDPAPQIGPDPQQAPVAPAAPQKPGYMTDEWMHNTAKVLQTNPEAARKWFLGSVAGLARKKGLKYHIVAQEPGSDDVIQGGELGLEDALEILRRRKTSTDPVTPPAPEKLANLKRLLEHAQEIGHVAAQSLQAEPEQIGKKLLDQSKTREVLEQLVGAFNPEQLVAKAAEWVSPGVEAQHATKHGPEMGLSEQEYSELAGLLSRVRSRRPVNRRKNQKGQETLGYDLRGFRLVTNPEGKLVSLYQKAAALGVALPEYLGGAEFLNRFKAPETELPQEDEDYEDFADLEDVPQYRPLSQEQLEQIRQYLAEQKTAEDQFSTWVDPDLSENHEYRVLKNEEKEVLAYIRIQPWADGHFLSNFWVRKGERGKGLGKKLMSRVIEELGKKQLFLKAEPFDGNQMGLEGLKNYYKKFGFIAGREDLMRRPATAPT